jgi:hypothetical protein
MVQPRLRNNLVKTGRHYRNRVIDLGSVEDAEAMMTLVRSKEAHGVIRGFDAYRRLENLHVPLFHRFEVAGVQNDMSKFR